MMMYLKLWDHHVSTFNFSFKFTFNGSQRDSYKSHRNKEQKKRMFICGMLQWREQESKGVRDGTCEHKAIYN